MSGRLLAWSWLCYEVMQLQLRRHPFIPHKLVLDIHPGPIPNTIKEFVNFLSKMGIIAITGEQLSSEIINFITNDERILYESDNYFATQFTYETVTVNLSYHGEIETASHITMMIV